MHLRNLRCQGTHVKDSVVIAPYDTGLYEMVCCWVNFGRLKGMVHNLYSGSR